MNDVLNEDGLDENGMDGITLDQRYILLIC